MAQDEQTEVPWITIERFRDLSSAIVARSALEAAGIQCFLRDENTVRLDWQISNFIGGMRLQVMEPDRDAALEVLNGLALEAAADDGESCPHCGSRDVHRDRERRGLALLALYVLSLPIARGKVEWCCYTCGKRWEDDSSG